MKRRQIAIFSLFALCAFGAVVLFLGRGQAKRGRPPVIKPVQIGGTEYRVPNTYSTEGVVEARNAQANKLLWRIKIYSTLHIPLLFEEDNEWNLIKSMTIGNSTNELVITNERGGQYILNTVSRKVKREKGSILSGW
jgi:hypothetical protein